MSCDATPFVFDSPPKHHRKLDFILSVQVSSSDQQIAGEEVAIAAGSSIQDAATSGASVAPTGSTLTARSSSHPERAETPPLLGFGRSAVLVSALVGVPLQLGTFANWLVRIERIGRSALHEGGVRRLSLGDLGILINDLTSVGGTL